MTSHMESPTPRDARPLLVGFDGSPASLVALDRAIVMARALGAPLRLVSAWQMPVQYSGFGIVDWSPEEFARAIVDDAVRARFGADVPVWLTTELHQGGAASVLIRLSREAQMLVVGSRGHGGFVGLLLGSVSSACAEHARCPVLVMHDEPAAAPIPAPPRVRTAVA
ncbi:Universal stress protein/MT2698 [Clavibacter michiganensis subsp. michiganensis]|uniref:universal stress protein n=1 Tax=Clavibacter michiganensis TaxID=28447 RepID=UPI0020B16DD9|nr:universal stress protein [Clavibacter michiganensis]KAF0259870.1 Universal stress protein/MT2698 [Clavibacter michiganensis subsp. michiganensis]